jgi:ATP-dependent RNA helicase RhlE
MTSSFAELGLSAPLVRAVTGAGYVTPTPIQAQAIPHLLQSRDLLGLAQTGTGKTAAFVLPILQHLRSAGSRAAPQTARALILAPTRELAIQIHETIRTLAKDQHFSFAAVYGGVSINPQIDTMRRGVDILVATPGRLIDLLKQKHLRLDAVRHFVLDEADRMLDMGFIRDIKRILPLLPKERQSMLFSATMPESIGEIAATLLRDPVQVEVRPETITIDRIRQHIVYLPQNAKRDALLALVAPREVTRALVFARTKHGANRLQTYLESYGVEVSAIHGNKSQGARQRALAAFKSGEVRILVATDIAARGIDVNDVSHVINAELPDEPESYVHRIGRTARAGREGVAITLCDPSERDKLRAIERLTRQTIPPMTIPGLDLAASRSTAKISEDRAPRGAGRPGQGRRKEEGGRSHQPPRAAGPRPMASREPFRRPDDKRDERVAAAGLPRFLDRSPQEARSPRAGDARTDRAPRRSGRG